MAFDAIGSFLYKENWKNRNKHNLFRHERCEQFRLYAKGILAKRW